MSKYYQNLFEKFKNRDISKEELDKLLIWINQNDDFRDSEVLEKVWLELEGSGAIEEDKARRIQAKLKSRIREEKLKDSLIVRRLNPWIYRVAAGFVLVAACALGLWNYLNSPIVVESGFGEIVEVTLPDNSKVRLNANSQISYPRSWSSQEVRTVSLDGEAFFEVTKDTEDHKKFVVNTKDLSVEVLGTEFNVNTRDISTRVFLEAGSVKLNALHGKDSLLMAPGEEAGFDDRGSLSKSQPVHAIPPADWKDGSMILKDIKLSEILKEYENVFGEKYSVADKELLNQSFTVMFPITDKDKALNILKNLIGNPIEME
ncbi:FecR family protein [Membranihabitans maritimus]|uniref:FecR family protein n=1 Tax=Membranihabitans maritimus TaxID=2904244 RepID=UPI001F26B54E|nr:FecR domain-containing protein [Membranihabitans maritimus]